MTVSNMESVMIDIAGFDEESITNGPGLRFVLFVQGCPHHCPGCHNPETHEFGRGSSWSVDAIFDRIRRNPLVRGVTFSGGEPFCQAEELARLGKRLKEAGYELAVYSGYTLEELLNSAESARQELLQIADVLVDGRFDLRQRDILLRFRGSRNQRVLNLPASLEAHKPILMPEGRWNRIA